MIMNTKKRNILLILAALFTFAAVAMFSLHDSYNDWSVIVDGAPVHGFAGAGFAFGGAIIGLAAAVLAVVFVSLILTGVSIFVVIVLSVVFCVVVVALSPLLLPLLLVIGLVMLFKRKKTPMQTN